MTEDLEAVRGAASVLLDTVGVPFAYTDNLGAVLGAASVLLLVWVGYQYSARGAFARREKKHGTVNLVLARVVGWIGLVVCTTVVVVIIIGLSRRFWGDSP